MKRDASEHLIRKAGVLIEDAVELMEVALEQIGVAEITLKSEAQFADERLHEPADQAKALGRLVAQAIEASAGINTKAVRAYCAPDEGFDREDAKTQGAVRTYSAGELVEGLAAKERKEDKDGAGLTGRDARSTAVRVQYFGEGQLAEVNHG